MRAQSNAPASGLQDLLEVGPDLRIIDELSMVCGLQADIGCQDEMAVVLKVAIQNLL